ncbi:MAG: hypothetical protein GVY12_00130 [Bacteroidetes bacterium]|jgi:hypothetical protein|nr:hypothetical protein [Bacteroidota bacterium]
MLTLTPGRLLLLAIVVTVACADGAYRLWKRRAADEIGPNTFGVVLALLVLGAGLAWAGVLVEWLDA